MKQKLLILTAFLITRYLRRWESRETFLRWQEKRIVRHIKKIRKKSAFYQRHWGGLHASDWRLFPMIDKQVMMDNFDELNTEGIKKADAFHIALQAERTRDFSSTIANITIGLSSGTSGNRGLFLVSERERYAWAGTVMAKVLPGSLLRREKIAFFLRADSKLYSSVRGGGRIHFEFYDLLEPIDRHIEHLNDYQPSLLVGPPSLLRMLAEASKSHRLNIQPTKIVSVAEVLDPLDQTIIQSTFDQLVHQIYQCTEGFLASTCRYGTLHLNEDIVCIEKEYVDHAQKKFIPIITDFTRLTQPIVRYRLNDLLTELDGCRCGSIFTAIQGIEGRSDDVFYFSSEDNKTMIPVFPDYISRAIITATPELHEYKAIQWDVDRVEIMLKIDESLRYSAADQIRHILYDLFDKLGCCHPQLSFTEYQAPELGVKLRRVERKFTFHDGYPII